MSMSHEKLSDFFNKPLWMFDIFLNMKFHLNVICRQTSYAGVHLDCRISGIEFGKQGIPALLEIQVAFIPVSERLYQMANMNIYTC